MERSDRASDEALALADQAAAALASGDWAAAARDFETLVQQIPGQVAYKFELARAYEHLGRFDDAIGLLSEPDVALLPKGKQRLAGMYIRAKEFALAKPLVDELC